MNSHLAHPLQMLECFGVGVLCAAGIVVFVVVMLIVGNELEGPVDVWFMRHPRVKKAVLIAASALACCGLIGGIFYLGCSVLEGL